MEVIQAFLAESVTSDSTGKFDAKGIFWQFNAEKFPASLPPFTFVLVFSADRASVKTPLHLWLSVDGKESGENVYNSGLQVNLTVPSRHDADRIDVDFQLVLNFEGMTLPSPDDYDFSYRFDEESAHSLKLRATTKKRNTKT